MIELINGNALHIPLADKSVQCVVTSPPYYGLRDYGTAKWEGGDEDCDHREYLGGHGEKSKLQVNSAGTQNYQYKDICKKCGAKRVDKQLGLEQTPQEYVDNMVNVFREVWRVLRDDGTVWLNLGDSYAGSGGAGGDYNKGGLKEGQPKYKSRLNLDIQEGLKPKDLIGIPWRVAFALQADGWYLRSDIIWNKTNPMPESVRDRPTKSHEYIFLLTKNERYYFDQDAVREPHKTQENRPMGIVRNRIFGYDSKENKMRGFKIKENDEDDNFRPQHHGNDINYHQNGRNIRTVWTISTAPYKGAHFATYPPALIEPCIKAGTSEKGCCPKCGKPWIRVVEKGESMWEKRKEEGAPMRKGTSIDRILETHKLSGSKHAEWKAEHPDSFVGWKASCKCGIEEAISCVVFDPFAGSGTTLLVARNLGRSSIGLDLKYDYLHEQARKRLELDKLALWKG